MPGGHFQAAGTTDHQQARYTGSLHGTDQAGGVAADETRRTDDCIVPREQRQQAFDVADIGFFQTQALLAWHVTDIASDPGDLMATLQQFMTQARACTAADTKDDDFHGFLQSDRRPQRNGKGVIGTAKTSVPV